MSAVNARIESFLKEFSSLSAAESPVVVFDCDGTIIMGDIGEAMFFSQIEQFHFRSSPAEVWRNHPQRDHLHTLFVELSAVEPEERNSHPQFDEFADMLLSWYFGQLARHKTAMACSEIVRLLAGFTPEEAREFARATVQKELASRLSNRPLGKRFLPKGVRYIRESTELLRRCIEAGCDVWAISGSNQWSVEAVFEPLGLPRKRVVGIDLVTTDGRLTSGVIQPVPVLEGKVDILKERAARQPVAVISDSEYDTPLFEYARDLRVLVNSRNGSSGDFFKRNGIRNDASWAVIEEPTVVERREIAWPMQQ
jgi:phosphoserine phosphatase